MKTVPVIALKNKSKENRYLAANMDVGDWSDPELDVSIDEIGNAFLIWRKDLSKPTEKDIDEVKAASEAYKKFMFEKFGENAIVSFDFEKLLKEYDPVDLEITREQFEQAKEIAEM
ncbi:hypothetical protein [Niallia sp. 03190]|uniref:hypothetical protein n=1 Tax=Niallia sp. 03190 TaxID=3458061 RepID=UPI0040448073